MGEQTEEHWLLKGSLLWGWFMPVVDFCCMCAGTGSRKNRDLNLTRPSTKYLQRGDHLVRLRNYKVYKLCALLPAMQLPQLPPWWW